MVVSMLLAADEEILLFFFNLYRVGGRWGGGENFSLASNHRAQL